jgi:hypothetical protein
MADLRRCRTRSSRPRASAWTRRGPRRRSTGRISSSSSTEVTKRSDARGGGARSQRRWKATRKPAAPVEE